MLHAPYPDHSDSIEEMYTTAETLMVEIARLVKATLAMLARPSGRSTRADLVHSASCSFLPGIW